MGTTMPRFFFHLEDGATFLDADGIDLPDLKAARDEAIRATGEMLREIPNAIHRGVALGDVTAMTLSMLGVGALLATSAMLFTALKWIGAVARYQAMAGR
jgi:hypothetical protein